MAALLSVQEAQQKLIAGLNAVGTEQVSLPCLTGRTLAEDITSTMDVPPFDNSSMDGFALRASDTLAAGQQSPVSLKVVIDIPAGAPAAIQIQPGEAARIMTGAPLPAGANAVVPIENTNLSRRSMDQKLPDSVELYQPIAQGENVRPQGQDLKTGEVVLRQGRRLSPQDIGLLASLGKTRVAVHRRPHVAMLTSGSELLSADQPLEPGKIRDSNTPMLAALIEKSGAQILPLGIAPDNADDVRKRLDQAVQQKVDLIVTTAGVSVGAFDYVRAIIEEHGQLNFWRVNMRPGKPVAFGYYQGIPLIGLPGNPVSAFVGSILFVLPALDRLSGLPHLQQHKTRVRTNRAVESDGRESYLRVALKVNQGKLLADLTGHQGSSNLYALAKADALLIVPAGITRVEAGEELDAIILRDVG